MKREHVFNMIAILVSILAGYVFGRSHSDQELAAVIVLSSMCVGVALLFVGAFVGPEEGYLGVLGLAAYVVAFVLLDPVCFMGKSRELRLVPILLLTPVICGAVVFVPRGHRLAGLGSWVVIFGAVLAMTNNVREGGYVGISLLGGRWIQP